MRTAPTCRALPTKQVLNRVTSKQMPFDWSLNPYRGCSHGCSFCYARSTHKFMGLNVDDAFRQQIFVKEDAAIRLREQLQRKLRRHRGSLTELRREIRWVAIGTATDPYQHIEANRRITRACLEVLREFRIPTSITTRSPLILRDVDILQDMDIHSINISLHTMDRDIWRAFEPATPSPVSRLDTVASLERAKLPVGVFIAPILPFITDAPEHLAEVMKYAKESGAQFVMASILRLAEEIKPWFMSTLRTWAPHLEVRYRKMYQAAYAPRYYVEAVMQAAKQQMQTYGFDDGYKRSNTLNEAETPKFEVHAKAETSHEIRSTDDGRSTQLVLPI